MSLTDHVLQKNNNNLIFCNTLKAYRTGIDFFFLYLYVFL